MQATVANAMHANVSIHIHATIFTTKQLRINGEAISGVNMLCYHRHTSPVTDLINKLSHASLCMSNVRLTVIYEIFPLYSE